MIKIGLAEVAESQVSYLGYSAFKKGRDLWDNPFAGYPDAHDAWESGWFGAQRELQKVGSRPTMTDYQLAIIACMRAQPGYVFTDNGEDDGMELSAARRMVRLGWLVETGTNRFAITKSGDEAYWETMRVRRKVPYETTNWVKKNQMLRVRFKRPINVEVRKHITAAVPGKREIWRFCEEHEYWVAAAFSQGGAVPTLYTLILVNDRLKEQYPDRIVNVPIDAFDIVEAKALVQ